MTAYVEHLKPFGEGNIRDGRALLLHDQKSYETGCEQTWKERDSKQAWVVVIVDSQQPQCGGGTDNRTEGVQHPLRAKGASICRLGDSSTGVRTPRPSHAVARANRTCHAVVASPIAAVPNAVTT